MKRFLKLKMEVFKMKKKVIIIICIVVVVIIAAALIVPDSGRGSCRNRQ